VCKTSRELTEHSVLHAAQLNMHKTQQISWISYELILPQLLEA